MAESSDTAALQKQAQELESRHKFRLKFKTLTKLKTSNTDADETVAQALEAAGLRDRTQDRDLRKKIAYWAIFFVVIQLGSANVFFGVYIFSNRHSPEPAIMATWLSSTVVEIIGILWVVARSLFPFHDGVRQEDGKKS